MSGNILLTVNFAQGIPNEIIVPIYGKGEDKHDYGKGFYLTERKELAKEWAVCNLIATNGWLHKYYLDCGSLKILDLELLTYRDGKVFMPNRVIMGWFQELLSESGLSGGTGR